MPNRIQLLDELVANQIAAGEVIERPASVLKELIENSIDAGAKKIDIEVEVGGRQLVRVTDDGQGMDRHDALLCLERHATSKVRTTQDIQAIHTLGFRGEAIPSIASISRFRLRTAETGAAGGTEVFIAGGKIETVKEVGVPVGTQIEVKNLFFNVPGRRKFLRSVETEAGHLEQLFRTYALAHPGVGWTYRVDNKTLYQLPATSSGERRLEDVLGGEWVKQLVLVKAQEHGLCLEGWIGRAGVSRSAKTDEYWFVNARPVESRTLYYAIREGYQNALMKGRHPIAVLFLKVPAETVDVNVHPAKREIRFREDFQIRQFLVAAIRNALQAPQPAPLTVSLSNGVPAPLAPVVDKGYAFSQAVEQSFNNNHIVVPSPLPQPEVMPLDLPLPLSRVQPQTQSKGYENYGPLRLRLLGIVQRLYIIAESEQGLVIIDQHAAHERVLFERVLKQKIAGVAVSQRLLVPISLELSPSQTAFLKSIRDFLEKAGLVIQEFGKNSFIIEAVPPFFPHEKIASLTQDILDELQIQGNETKAKRHFSEEVIVRAVCRKAIKANDKIRNEEVDRLIEDLLACDLPYTCPHGRPTLILLNHNELEKKFGRIN
ncbi:MAG: DNA mismatch repair endonuclease MutL [Verrucomicrobiae bacterium]|nr:DNA mismatch repair endonuclease MutL [Verrucomicrobiae bacterium]